MRRSRLCLWIAAGVCGAPSVLVACLFEVPATNAVPTDGGAPEDVAQPDQAADAEATNLVFNGDFERAGCETWSSYNGILSDDTLARSGKRACRVCRRPGGDTFVTFSPNFTSPSAVRGLRDGFYRAEAWIRKAPGSPNFRSGYISATLIDSRDIGAAATEGAFIVPSDTWSRVAVAFATPDGGVANLVMSPLIASASEVENTCLLVDDVAVYAVPQ